MPRFGLGVCTLACALTAAACAGTKQQPSTGNGGNTGSAGSGSGGTAAGGRGGGGPTGVGGIATGGTTGAGGMCVPSNVCTPPGGQYCGTIGAGCPGQKLECGACPGDGVCEERLCVGGPSCTPITCGTFCGTIGDNCGRRLDCTAACGAGQECRNGICVDPGCVPMTCNGANNARYCGMIGDGCGGTLDCGTCPNNGTCGGAGGIPNICNDPTCPRTSCMPMGGQYCGVIGNGCGGTQDCGACANGMACPTTGAQAHVCPGSTVIVPPTCPGATKTTISGVVYDPAGVHPLYNVIVYIPSGPLPTLPDGMSCDRCGAQVVAPLASALTDTQGRFTLTLEPVPSTTNVPLVMQTGKWRRQIMIPSLNTCANNALTDKNQTRLPRTRMEGNIPRIAVTTGKSDALECLIRRIGVADSEIMTDGGAGRVHLYAGGGGTNSFMAGGAFAPATALWSNRAKLMAYDALVLSCEGSMSEFAAMKPQTSVDNVANWVNSGGRLFVSHLHFSWLRNRPMDLGTTAVPYDDMDPLNDVTLTVNQGFPKGMALAQWLNGPMVNASPALGQLPVRGSEHSVSTVVPPTVEYLTYNSPRAAQYLSFNTPVGTPEAMQCGKVVFTDIHIQTSVGSTGGDDSDPSKPFPSGCKTNEMSPQAKALEFLFFDLSSCVEPPTTNPTPPPVPPPGTPTQPPPGAGRPPSVPPPPPPPPPPDPG
jgi:hypothetical protein